MSDGTTAPGRIEQLVNLIIVDAATRGATHIRIRPVTAGSSLVELWMHGTWVAPATPMPIELHDRVMRRLCVMLGLLLPPRGQMAFGRVGLVRGDGSELFVLVAVDHSDGDGVAGYLELVDHDTFITRSEPLPPTPHPYRTS